MHICLSSAARGGYSKDVVDILAAPEGGEQQFRYDQKWVEPHIIEAINSGELPPSSDRFPKCLLCFLDLRGKPEEPFILPLREAELTRVIPVGSTYTLVFRLGAFRRPADLNGFSDFARRTFPTLHHIEKGSVKPSGFLWLDVADKLDENLKPKATDEKWVLEWEGIVRDYLNVMKKPEAHSKKFLDEAILATDQCRFVDRSPFYTFYKLTPSSRDENLLPKPRDGRVAFKLKPGANYELSFYQFHPTESFPDASLTVTANDDHIDFIGGAKRRFDTRYDVKRFTFSTPSLLSGASGNISVARSFHDSGVQDVIEDMYLNYDIESSWFKMTAYVVGVAFAFAAPYLLVFHAGPSSPNIYVVALCGVALGLLTLLKDSVKLN